MKIIREANNETKRKNKLFELNDRTMESKLRKVLTENDCSSG